MTDYATCHQCTYCFVTNAIHPVPPAHNIPGTDIPCAGSGQEADLGAAR